MTNSDSSSGHPADQESDQLSAILDVLRAKLFLGVCPTLKRLRFQWTTSALRPV